MTDVILKSEPKKPWTSHIPDVDLVSPPHITTDEEYGRMLKRMLAMDPTMSIEKLAETVGRTAWWVRERLAAANA